MACTTGRGSRTRQLLIETAERLYAERGINGVSLREIVAGAGQRNTGAVRYHFGSKRELVDAVFAHRMPHSNARRLALLDEADAAERGRDAHALVEALVLPLSERLVHAQGPGHYLRFTLQTLIWTESPYLRDLRARPWTAGVTLIKSRFMDLFPGVPDQVGAHRWQLLNSFVLNSLAAHESRLAVGRPELIGSHELFVADLLDTAVALATAPLSPRSRALLLPGS